MTIRHCWLALAVLSLVACGGGEDTSSGPIDMAGTTSGTPEDVPGGDGFPTVWVLSRRRFDAFQNLFVVRERFVVAFADGTYSTDLEAIHGDVVDPPGTGERTGQWRLVGDALETRPNAEDDFARQFFAGYATTPGTRDQRLEGCWSGTSVPFGFAIVVSEACFSADGRYRAGRDNLDVPGDDGAERRGTYTIDGHRLTLANDAGGQERGAFAILAGPREAPTSLMINGERLSTP